MKDALAIHRWLLAHQVHHEIVRLPRPMTCVDELPRMISAAPGRCVAVTVFEVTTRMGRGAVAVVAPVSSPPLPGVVGGQLGARNVRPASAFVVNAVTDYAAGLVGPLLLPEDLRVLLDDRLPADDDHVYIATGERFTALRLRALDLASVLTGKTVDLRIPSQRGSREAVALPY
ncbi:aminoacyl-tRNA deacylase [Nonomuraea sp. NPDC050556]|uniref:aminoacyl-tRNA deacylase n=1 Tax=Nonomuraea sp. NPDC050556 TaxID=3364369 RepID=UPI0037B5E466